MVAVAAGQTRDRPGFIAVDKKRDLFRFFFLSSAAALALAAGTVAAQTAGEEPQCGGVTGNPRLAIQVCTRAIEFGSLDRPELAKAYYTRGSEYASQGNHDRAIADFNLAVELEPGFAQAFYNRALSWAHKGNADRAIADYDAALKLQPKDASAYLGRAVEWTVKGDYKRSVADYNEAIRIDPKSSSGYFGRARARFYAEDFMAAASDFYRAHQLEPSIYAALWLFLARKRADIPGEKTLAQDAGTSGADDWPAPVVALYLGSVTPEAVQKAAAHADAVRERDQRCEANFYVAQWHVLRGAREAALKLLREAESGCPRTFIEHEGAVAELRRLQQNP